MSYGDSRGNITGIGSAGYGYSSENLMTTAPNSVTMAYDPLTRLYQLADGSNTSSGKLSRAKARNLYLTGEIQTYAIAA